MPQGLLLLFLMTTSSYLIHLRNLLNERILKYNHIEWLKRYLCFSHSIFLEMLLLPLRTVYWAEYQINVINMDAIFALSHKHYLPILSNKQFPVNLKY